MGSTATTLICEASPDHLKYFVQSYVFSLSRESLLFLFSSGFFDQDFARMSKFEQILYAEVSMSMTIMRGGLNMETLQSCFFGRDFLLLPRGSGKNIYMNAAHEKNGYYGMDIHPFEVLFLKYNDNTRVFSEEVDYYTRLYLD